MDGRIVSQHPFDPSAPAISANVPMIVGTTLNEFVNNINNPDGERMTSQTLLERTKMIYGDRAKQVLAAFRERTPSATPFAIWSRISCAPIRSIAIEQCIRKAEQGASPVYLYWFTWQTPILDGRPGAFHCSELPFVFNNPDRCNTMTGGGPAAAELARRMSASWVRFARTGNPNGANLPRWPAFSPQTWSTMVFDNQVQALDGPDAKELAAAAL